MTAHDTSDLRRSGLSVSGLRFVLLTTFAASGLAVTPALSQQTPFSERMTRFERHVEMRDASPFGTVSWQFLGPTNVGGRATDVIALAPRGQTHDLWIAEATGGVWRSQNDGITWEPVFDQDMTTSTGDLAIAPSNPDIVWIGTGEANIFRSSFAGAGIYKSTDGGDTFAYSGLGDTQTIARIITHPTDPDVVWVAASGHEWTDNPDRGVYKTSDGGRSWTKVLYVDEGTAAIDLVIDPRTPDRLYASTWERRRKKWNDPRVEVGSENSGIWRSEDGGESWSPINEGLAEPQFRGRIGLDIARSNPDVIYAFVDNYQVSRPAAEGETNAYGLQAADVIRGSSVWRSDNRGESWRQVSENSPQMERMGGTYGWVFGQIRVDPNDENTVYVMGLGLNVSNDGGRTFRSLGGMHGDHHGLWIDPANSSTLFNANDGGAYISFDAGLNWRSFTSQINAVQFFNVNYDMGEPFQVYGSVQDHGSYRGTVDLSRGRLSIPAVDWLGAPGGEGSHHAMDPNDPNTVFSAGFYGSISRTNIETGESQNIAPQPPEGELAYRGQWLAHFILSPHNPYVVYHGFQYLFRSMDRGDTWERISPDLTSNDPSQLGDIPFQTIVSISESPLRFGRLYVGTDDGHLWTTPDGGETWTELTERVVPGKWVSRVEASRFDEGTVYVAQNGKRDDDFLPYLWKSEDFGETWTDISGGIPLGPINVVREDPTNPDVLYAGTDVGVYVSIDRGDTWLSLPGELPSTFVSDLVVHPRDGIAVASTHGRGMWALDVSAIQQMNADIAGSPAHLFDVHPIDIDAQGRAPATPIYFYLQEPGSVTLQVRDESGNIVGDLQAQGTAGMNFTVVQMGAGGGRGRGAGRGGGRGGRGGGGQSLPELHPGTYSIFMTAAGTTTQASMPVRAGR